MKKQIGEAIEFLFDDVLYGGLVCHVFEEGFQFDDGLVLDGTAYVVNLDSEDGPGEGLTAIINEEYILGGEYGE